MKTRASISFIRRLAGNTEGSNAVEFALIAPVFLIALIGFVSLCLALFSMGSLQFAVEGGARCASVQTTVCIDNASVESYIEDHYYGVDISPSYAHEDQDCGKYVSASFTYVLDMIVHQISIPIKVSACYP
ncbi:MAG: pilus assembly protein [Alphaproteobacteria bacterium]|nr:pilus assembly protein [Alphaproteobacteria bacterium]MBF0128481.1 pilus assembly protein [Alphaproteobacteria bacterium]